MALYPKRCAPGPLQPGGCQNAGTDWCGYHTITFSYGDSRGLLLCVYDPESDALAGVVLSARGELTCRTLVADFPPEEFFESTCGPGGVGGAGGTPGSGGAGAGGANTGGASSGGTGGASSGGTGGASSGGTGGASSGGTGGILDSGAPDGAPGGSDAGTRDASSD